MPSNDSEKLIQFEFMIALVLKSLRRTTSRSILSSPFPVAVMQTSFSSTKNLAKNQEILL